MIQHAAHKTRFHRAKLSPGIGEHILAEIDAETLHLGEEAVHLRRRGVVVGVVFGAEEAAVAIWRICLVLPLSLLFDNYRGTLSFAHIYIITRVAPHCVRHPKDTERGIRRD